MKKNILILSIFLGISLQAQSFKQYCNSKFDFCVQIPQNFKGAGESLSEDGQHFTSADGKAIISAYGTTDVQDINDLKTTYNDFLKTKNVTYKFRKDNYFILSGIESNGNVFYMKSIKKRAKYMGMYDNVIHTLIITYPKSQNSKYSEYCKIISKSF